ncbi:MAG: trypsin-like peptidase domain-containing protein [Thermoguttaceae bacterium]|jgi:S1-C subfamily serine protease
MRIQGVGFLLLCLVAAVTSAAHAAQPPTEVLAAESQRIAVMAKASSGVLAIFDPAGQGGGSGVVISADGYALSNFHVTHPCGDAMKCGMSDGRVYDAVIVGLDPTGDIALIKLLGRNDFPHAELGDSDRLRAGDWVFAMGNPFLLATDFQPTVTSGIISGVHRYQFPDGTLLEYADCLQTDASINPGNSGGPLFNSQGQVVGINGRCSFDKRGRVSVDVGYAVSINQIKNFLGVLRSGRIVDHATLGARVAADDQGRVLVSDILETSDAYRRGLRTDDEIINFAGRPITTPNGFKNALGIFPKGWRVSLTYRRENKTYPIYVRLTGVHGREQLIEKTLGRPAQPMPIPKPGEKGRKGQPRPPQLPQMQPQKAPMPEVVKKVFQEKHGFANYFFNKQEQDRVLKLWKPPGDAKGGAPGTPGRGVWTFVGRLQSGKEIRFRMADNEVELKAPAGDSKWTLGPKFAEAFQPGSNNGLLPAMFLYRLMALDGPKGFTDVYYLGTLPLPPQEGLLDVVVAAYHGIESWFYFDSHGRLAAMEIYADEHSDPWEIHFAQYRDVDSHDLPGHVVVYGNGSVFEFDCEQFRFTDEAVK